MLPAEAAAATQYTPCRKCPPTPQKDPFANPVLAAWIDTPGSSLCFSSPSASRSGEQVRTPATTPAPQQQQQQQQQQQATPAAPRSSSLLLDRFNDQEDEEEDPDPLPPPLSPSPSDSDPGVFLHSGRSSLSHQAAGCSPNEVNPTAGPRLRPASSRHTLPPPSTKKGGPSGTPAPSSQLSASEVAFQNYCRLVQKDKQQSQSRKQQQQRSRSLSLPFSGLLFPRAPQPQPDPSEPHRGPNACASMSRTPGAPAVVDDSPKGLAALFVKLCPSLAFLGLQDRARSMLGRLRSASPLITKFAWALIGPLLLLLKLVSERLGLGAAIFLGVIAFGTLLVAEQMALAKADEEAAEQKRQQASLGNKSKRLLGHPFAMQVFAPPGSVSQAASREVAAASPAKASRAAPSTSRGDATVKQVREKIMKLESVLYGNELTEGVLPADALPLRVQKLCEDLGVVYAPKHAGAAEMLQALLQVEAAIGV